MGKSRQIFELNTVKQIQKRQAAQHIYHNGQLTQPALPKLIAIPICPQEIRIHLETPLRIKQDGKNCNQERLTFAAFFGNLLRRISMLTYFHTDTPLVTDFADLMAQSKTVRIVEQQLAWHDWTLYSSRQQTKMAMSGLLGTFTTLERVCYPFHNVSMGYRHLKTFRTGLQNPVPLKNSQFGELAWQ